MSTTKTEPSIILSQEPTEVFLKSLGLVLICLNRNLFFYKAKETNITFRFGQMQITNILECVTDI